MWCCLRLVSEYDGAPLPCAAIYASSPPRARLGAEAGGLLQQLPQQLTCPRQRARVPHKPNARRAVHAILTYSEAFQGRKGAERVAAVQAGLPAVLPAGSAGAAGLLLPSCLEVLQPRICQLPGGCRLFLKIRTQHNAPLTAGRLPVRCDKACRGPHALG